MKREELWIIYIRKYPKFAQSDAQITFTAKGLRQFFEKTYDIAYRAGQEHSKPKDKPVIDNPFKDLFGGFF